MTRTSILTSSLAVLYVVGVSLASMEEIPSSSNLHHYNTMLNSVGFDDPVPDKRAYTYVSEYKRLPVYNFGIGKRWADNGDDKVSKKCQYLFKINRLKFPKAFIDINAQ